MSNIHSQLSNDQLHSPKDFEGAGENTVLAKDNSGNLSWEYGLVYQFKKEISSAEILTLHTNPIELVPAPGQDKVIDLMTAFAELSYNSAPYDTNTRLEISWANADVHSVYDTEFLKATASFIRPLLARNFTLSTTDNVIAINSPISLSTASGNPQNGDSSMIIRGSYRIVDLSL